MQQARAWTEWAVWRWTRGILLTLSGVFALAALRVTSIHGELIPGEVAWVVAMVAAVLGLAWLPKPTWWVAGFALLFLGSYAAAPAVHYGAAWLLVYAVCLDANSRRPIWLGIALVGVFISPDLVLGAAPDVTAYGVVYLALAAGLGQFIHTAFALSRSQSRAHELERRLELAAVARDVHDTGTSRLTQVVLLARGIQERDELTERSRADLGLLIESASAAAADLRRAADPARALGVRTDAVGSFLEEWDRSLRTLRAAGFRVEDHGPEPGLETGSASTAAARVVVEATANICKHAAPGGRVEALAMLQAGVLVLEWRNPIVDAARAETGGMGVPGLWARVAEFGGLVSTRLAGDGFCLRVEIPWEPQHG